MPWDGDFASRFQPSLLRYERVILLFDPDADGIHCGTLALLFFYRWMPALIDENRLLIVRAPMMEIVTSGLPGPLLAYSEEEGESHLQSVTAQTRSPVSKKRFRGLASLNGDMLLRCCIDPRTRRHFRLTSRDAVSSLAIMGLLPE